MGRAAELRRRANSVRESHIGTMRQTGSTGSELHTGSWQVTYMQSGKIAESAVVTANYIDQSKQQLLYAIGARSSSTTRHVEDDFLIDLVVKFKETGAKPLYLSPTLCAARADFWLYYSPCANCLEKIRKFVTNKLSYDQNNGTAGCWIEMTFDMYYPAWGNPDNAKREYQRLLDDTRGAVVIRQYDVLTDGA